MQVYWDRDHDCGWATFDIDSRKRPDLLTHGANYTDAIEVTVGDDRGKIHDGFAQLVQHWRSCVDDELSYRINDQPRSIDAFLLATGRGPHGRIYNAEGESDVRPVEIEIPKRMIKR